jgi:hypothetical protein
MENKGLKPRHLKTSVGLVEFERERWVCPNCGTSIFPLDERLGLTPYVQTTKRQERFVCEVGVRLPYSQSEVVLQVLVNVSVPRKQVAWLCESAWATPDCVA